MTLPVGLQFEPRSDNLENEFVLGTKLNNTPPELLAPPPVVSPYSLPSFALINDADGNDPLGLKSKSKFFVNTEPLILKLKNVPLPAPPWLVIPNNFPPGTA